MSSEEDDYMSEHFVSSSPKKDVRPGLIKSRITHRTIEMESRKRKIDGDYAHRNQSTKTLEQERRAEGLNAAINSTNKGFSMLAKMGYREGEGIGKSRAGIVEPIGIQLKTDRGGLGREAALKQLKEKQAEIRARKLLSNQSGSVSTEEFRKRIVQKAQEKQIASDLGKCQRACERLDLNELIERPPMIWFWPVREVETNEKDDDDASTTSSDEEALEDAYEPFEKLEMICNYLRTTYCYCHWCGTQYTDADDLTDNCPGLTKDDH